MYQAMLWFDGFLVVVCIVVLLARVIGEYQQRVMTDCIDEDCRD